MEAYLHQSMLYLKDAQATLREEAIRFIGEPQPPGSLFWQPGPSPSYCTDSKLQPCGCQSLGCPMQGLGRRGLCASLSHPCPRKRAWWQPCSVPLPSGTVLPWGQPC